MSLREVRFEDMTVSKHARIRMEERHLTLADLASAAASCRLARDGRGVVVVGSNGVCFVLDAAMTTIVTAYQAQPADIATRRAEADYRQQTGNSDHDRRARRLGRTVRGEGAS